jgi:2-methylisocitrate lyase-like PEP mutase family enzyme
MDERRTTRLRRLLEQPGTIYVLSSYDALSARLVEDAGFPVGYVGGYVTSAALLGLPDVGLLTMTELVDQARRVTLAVSVPVICDADTGFGNPVNVRRTVREFIAAGVAGIHIEDQVLPKRPGHSEGKEVIPTEHMVQKIRAAVDARNDPDFVIIARTDAGSVTGLDDAIARGRAYRAAGADMVFVEAIRSEDEAALVARSIDAPLFFNAGGAPGKKTPHIPAEKLEAMGYKIIFFSGVLNAAAQAVKDLAAEIKTKHSLLGFVDRLYPFLDFQKFIGFDEAVQLEEAYGLRSLKSL